VMSAAPLVRLVRSLESSLPMFLAECGIWSYPGPEEVRTGLASLVAEQREILGQATELLAEREVAAPRPGFPIAWTGLHDVDLRHLLPRIIEGLARQADECAAVAAAAAGTDAAAATFAAEAEAVTRRHHDEFARLLARSTPPAAAV
jgi:hypothetical protein